VAAAAAMLMLLLSSWRKTTSLGLETSDQEQLVVIKMNLERWAALLLILGAMCWRIK
jgi:hypothetical protein